MAVARRVGDPATLAHVLTTLGGDDLDVSTLEERLSNTAEVVELAQTSGSVGILLRHLVPDGDVHGGRVLDEYERAFKDVMDAAGELGQATPVWMAAFTASADEFLRGNLDRAEERALESLDLGQRAQPARRGVLLRRLALRDPA